KVEGWSMRVLAGRTPVKGPPFLDERHVGAPQALGECRICERNNLRSVDLDVAVQVSDQVTDARRFGRVARTHDQDVLERRADDIYPRTAAMKNLAEMEHGPRGQLEREPRAVGRLHDPANTLPVIRRHRQFHHVY